MASNFRPGYFPVPSMDTNGSHHNQPTQHLNKQFLDLPASSTMARPFTSIPSPGSQSTLVANNEHTSNSPAVGNHSTTGSVQPPVSPAASANSSSRSLTLPLGAMAPHVNDAPTGHITYPPANLESNLNSQRGTPARTRRVGSLSPIRWTDYSTDSPPTTAASHQHLLSYDTKPDLAQSPPAQYATYPRRLYAEQRGVSYATGKSSSSEDFVLGKGLGTPPSNGRVKFWTPLPLKIWFWPLLVLAMVLCAIGLQFALSESNKRNGWPVSAKLEGKGFHYAITLPPIFVAMTFVALWAWTDIEIKKMQPYVELVQHDAQPKRSLLLDYTRINNFFVWISAMRNRHYLVALATLMLLMTLSFQPLAATLLDVRDVWVTKPGPTMQSLASLALNKDAGFDELTYFLTSASYASSDVLFEVGNPAFIFDQYAVAPFELPTGLGNNGTVHANTTAVKTSPGCQAVTVTKTQTPGVDSTTPPEDEGTDITQTPDSLVGWDNTATLNGCGQSWHVNKSSPTLFGTDVLDCENSDIYKNISTPFRPVVFWFFTYQPKIFTSATFCYPSFQLTEVNVEVDLASGNVTALTELGPVTQSSNFSEFSGNLTGPPLDGQAYNGIGFDLQNVNTTGQPNPFIVQRRDSIALQMPAGVLQAATQSPAGLTSAFETNDFVGPSSRVYQMYLNLVASKVYYIPHNEDMYQEVSTFEKRLFLSDTATHLLTVALLILAIFGTIIQLLHRHERRHLRFLHEPGTIASAVSIAGHTHTSNLLAQAGHTEEEEMKEVLGNRKFRIDPRTMRIVMEGEDGWEYAASPDAKRRKSFFKAMMADGGELERRTWLGESGQTPSGLPKSPLSSPGPGRLPGSGRV